MLSPLDVFEDLESSVRSYIRSFPTVFTRARGSRMWDLQNRVYIDFFAGAGALNYGHNHPRMKEKLLDYVASDGIAHSLDMGTEAKARFLEQFQQVILEPRGLTYKVMFPGPTGTNAVESALKLARKATGRTTVVNFTNAFHGMTLGSLAVTGNKFKRGGAGVPLSNVVTMPYDGYFEGGLDSVDYLEQLLADGGSGISRPAAIILETVQGEGGVNVASAAWLRKVEKLCRRMGIVLIVDDIQVGCGRTGAFFSFEDAGLKPDIVCLSKSISGYGLPMALTLIKPELDVWDPGEHNGTFRGHNLAFVTATEALSFWRNDTLEQEIRLKGKRVRARLERWTVKYPGLKAKVRGRGLILGLVCGDPEKAKQISAAAFERGLIIETAGPDDEVVKLLPPLTIDPSTLDEGLQILEDSIEHVL
ncbi:diaminobutyrate--2-oxoglutarate transaminase [Alicyclobacillus cycloheptanicus]|nr:diaminobutyrate--2-oxoglutarate transaminase [Alicyclobacillus cycloheptanicus]WDM02845.1 diaminobutyrate--2-oxoglutarate transaminase [Alicyclobacillus cycloheptanicus]